MNPNLPIKVKLNSASYFTLKEREKLDRCCVKLEVIVNHPDFKQMFFEASFYGELSKYKDYSREDLWVHFCSGKEELNNHEDNEIDVDISIFNPRWRQRNVVGYTYPSVIKTWVNRKFFNWYGDAGICSNILHEWGHKIGFDHDFNSTNRRSFSICYRLNVICETVYKIIWPSTFEKLFK